MRMIQLFLHELTRRRRWWWALLGINFFGSLYGFWWYKEQLLATSWWQWPLVPDSPGSTFLFFAWLGLMLAGADWRRPGMQWLGAVAFLSNMKYGLWTAIVLPQAGIKYGWDFTFIHLSFSHFGMWVQAMLFARVYKPLVAPAVGALIFMWLQDLIDYRLWMTHPSLPYPEELTFARGTAMLLSSLWGTFLVVQAYVDRQSRNL